MGIMWFCLGCLLILALWGMFTWNSKRKKRFSVLCWTLLLVTLLEILFTIAWVVSSLIEDEHQSAGMGLLIFGFIAIVLMALTRRLIKRGTNKG